MASLVHRLDAPDLGLLEDDVVPARLLPHLGGGVRHDLADPGQVLVVGHREVDHRPGPALGFVADPVDGPVADVPDHAVHVAQPGDPEADRLDRPGGVARVDDVAHPVLVLEQHEDPGQEVTHQALRAEPDGDAEHTRAGQHRGQVQPEVTGDGHRRDAEDEHRRRVAQDRPEGLGPLPPPLAHQHVRRVGLPVGSRLRRPAGDLVDQPVGRDPDEHRDQQHEQDPQHHADRLGQPHLDQFGGVPVVQDVPGQPAGDPGLLACRRRIRGCPGVPWRGRAPRGALARSRGNSFRRSGGGAGGRRPATRDTWPAAAGPAGRSHSGRRSAGWPGHLEPPGSHLRSSLVSVRVIVMTRGRGACKMQRVERELHGSSPGRMSTGVFP